MNQSTTTTGSKIKFKIVFLGDQNVGKSCIIEKYIHNKFDETSNPTVGIDFLAKNIFHKNKNFRLQLWDTAGQERFRSLIPNYLKDAICAIVVFDVTNKQSLVNTSRWLRLYNDNKLTEGYTILVGNKIDLPYRVIKPEEGKAMANQLKIDYFEISAKSGQGVEELFLHIVDMLVDGKTNGTGNVLDAFKQEIKEEKEETQEEKEQKGTKRSRREEFNPSQVIDQTNSTMSKDLYRNQGQVVGAVVENRQPAGLSPYEQQLALQNQRNIILSNVQPPPVIPQNKSRCC